jgi:hypothetical protein
MQATAVSTTATTTAGSAAVTVVSATGLTQGQVIFMAGLAAGTTILSIAGTTVTLSATATATASAANLLAFTPGFVPLLASNIQNADGTPLAAGFLEIVPTDTSDNPLTAVAGGTGGAIATAPAVVTITNGAIPAGICIPDSSQTRPANLCYRISILDATTVPIFTWRTVQTAANTPLNLDTLQPNVPTQAIVQAGPPGAPGAAGVAGTLIAEVPGGVIGTDTTFTLAHTPASVIGVFRNGLLRAASEYTFNSATTFSWTTNPITQGESHAVLYIHA